MYLKSKLHRHQGGRKQIAKDLLRALFVYGKVETSESKAKALKSMAERVLTVARQDTLFARKRVASVLGEDKVTTRKIFTEVMPSLGDKTSGYTRILRLGKRLGDGSERARLELIKIEKPKPAKEVKAK
ncbi:MAG: 50S ribosomal protein L17 [bacterium]|nr:50S ribosomal protein L17 [bacterium]